MVITPYTMFSIMASILLIWVTFTVTKALLDALVISLAPLFYWVASLLDGVMLQITVSLGGCFICALIIIKMYGVGARRHDDNGRNQRGASPGTTPGR